MAQAHPKIISLMAQAPKLVETLGILTEAGHQAHLVGGSVRDAIMGRPVHDYDISTSARPDQVQGLFESLGYAVHPTGIEHGTVTVALRGEAFEVTTWRRDVETDGRRAVVEFADRLEDDAQRRDFTVNALYASADGCIEDPTGFGLKDAADQRIRFVGCASARIREDVLRILRFYRFEASHGTEGSAGIDELACQQHGHLVEHLPRERVGAEMLKLLQAPRARKSLMRMEKAGILQRVLPGLRAPLDGIDACFSFSRMTHQELMMGFDRCAIRRLSTLVDTPPMEDLKLSRKQARHIEQVLEASASRMGPKEMGYRYGQRVAEDAVLHRHALGIDTSSTEDAVLEARRGANAKFPITPKDLMPAFTGKALGDEIKRLECLWIASGLTAGAAKLLESTTKASSAQ